VHVLFFVSGAAALTYEVVWMRMLSFVFGNTAYAVSVVLAVFLGGLAIGAWVYGTIADRRSDLLRLYAILEGGAAAIALALPYVLLTLLTPLYTWLYQHTDESIAALTAARLVISALLLMPPAALLGGTLPVLVRFVVRSSAAMEPHIGRLYGINTLGGAAGAFFAGFVAMPALGLRLSNVAGVTLGLSVAGCALALRRLLRGARYVRPEWQPAPVERSGPHPSRAPVRWLLIAVALSGFAALAYEVLWTRLLVFYFETTVYAFSAMLCVYLIGLALGSFLYSALLSRARRHLRLFVILELLIGITAAATILLLPVLRRLYMPSLRGSFWGHFAWIFLATTAIMIVPTLLIGAVFPLVSAAWSRATGRLGLGVGQVYVANTVGTIFGSLAAGFLLAPTLGVRLSLFAVAGLSMFAGLIVWTALAGPASSRALRAAAAVALPAMLVLAMSRVFPAKRLAEVFGKGEPVTIESVRESIDGTVTVELHPPSDALAGQPATRVLAVNGVTVAGTDFRLLTTQKLQCHVAMLLHPQPQRVLHIGFGSGGTAYSVSRYPIERLDCVEISRAVVDAAPLFPETNRGILADPRLHVYLEDARTFVRHTPHRYDVILSDLVHPIYSGEGFFYSVDYLRDCHSLLKPGGFFSTWAPIYSLDLDGLKVMIRSVREAFPYVYIWRPEGGRNEFCIIQGRLEPLEVDYGAVARSMADPEVLDDLDDIGIRRPEEVLALLLYDHAAVDRWMADVDQLNTDDNGYLEFIASRSAYEYPNARRINALLSYPDLVMNSGGSIPDYVAGSGGAASPWRERLRRQVKAYQHILNARLHELARQDQHDLLALLEYRRALAVTPVNVTAEMLVGTTPAQMERIRQRAEAPQAAIGEQDQWLGVLVASGRLEEAQRWAERRLSDNPGLSAYAGIAAALRADPDAMERVLDVTSNSGIESFGGIPPEYLARAAAAERAVAENPGDSSSWRTLGRVYQLMVQGIWSLPMGVGETEAGVRLATFRLHAVARLLDLSAARYEEARSRDPSDLAAAVELASVLGAQGEYARAIDLLEDASSDLDASSPQQPQVVGLLESLWEKQQNPYAFLEAIQAAVLAQIRGERD
jgi:spermidine synthase